jgi:hypothetical protein
MTKIAVAMAVLGVLLSGVLLFIVLAALQPSVVTCLSEDPALEVEVRSTRQHAHVETSRGLLGCTHYRNAKDRGWAD